MRRTKRTEEARRRWATRGIRDRGAPSNRLLSCKNAGAVGAPIGSGLAAKRLKGPNGAKSLIFTADEPERLRGKQHEWLWADEVAAWRYPESWDQAMLGLRLGSSYPGTRLPERLVLQD